MVRVHLHIRGVVQGVYFRASTLHQARQLGLQGWVKNRGDGGVEIVAQGKKEDVDRLISWCHQGPPGAVVREVNVQWKPPSAQETDFFIQR